VCAATDRAWSLAVPDHPTKEEKPEDALPDGPPEENSPMAVGDGTPAPDVDHEENSSDDDDGGEEEDAASPEAIARRVAALGEDDESDRLARQEEQKLADRRGNQQKRGKKSGLEAAASKKLAKIGAKSVARRSVVTAVEADPLVDRAVKLGDWAKRNQGTVAFLVGAVVLAGVGAGIHSYVQKRHETQASVELAKAIEDEHGRIGDPDKEDEEGHPHDPRPIFKTTEDRREAALREYRDVESKFKGTGAGILARLAEGSILLDKQDVAGAVRAFDDVKDSALAKADAEVHGRALEGLGFAYELKADPLQGDAAKGPLEDAARVYRELENTDVLGFKELGMYHQARILEKQGDKPKAIELLKKLHERLAKPGENHPFLYLEHVADDRLRALDPAAIPAKPAGQLGGPGQNQLSSAQIRKLMEQMQKKEGPSKTGGSSSSAPMEPEELPP
jgi:hypothetical protein